MFMRACQATSSKDMDEQAQKNVKELLRDVSELRKALESDLAATMWTGDGGQHNELWLGRDETAAAATAMKPKMQTARKAIEALLFEVVALEVLRFPPPFASIWINWIDRGQSPEITSRYTTLRFLHAMCHDGRHQRGVWAVVAHKH